MFWNNCYHKQMYYIFRIFGIYWTQNRLDMPQCVNFGLSSNFSNQNLIRAPDIIEFLFVFQRVAMYCIGGQGRYQDT